MTDAPYRPVTIVTGSSRGIGAAIAERLGRSGHRLVLVARSADGLAATAAAVRATGTEAAVVTGDLRDEATSVSAVEVAHSTFGGLDAAISNAGTAPTAKVEATTGALLQETFDLHVAAPLALARAALPRMRERGAGCLLHLASTAGLRGYPFTAAYTAAKHGMVGLARAMRAELGAAGIDVYAVCPGFVDSAITRGAADAIAARGKTTADAAFERMAAQNAIGRMHSVTEVADAVAEIIATRPPGCVYELDRDPPAFLD